MTQQRDPSTHDADSCRELADGLHSAAIHLLRRLRKVDEATGLSPARLSALSVLVFGRPMTLGELAAAEQVRPPSMTRLVRDMQRDGLVTTRKDATDRRAIRIAATPRGAALMRQGRGARVALLAEALAKLTAQERQILDRAVLLLRKAVEGLS